MIREAFEQPKANLRLRAARGAGQALSILWHADGLTRAPRPQLIQLNLDLSRGSGPLARPAGNRPPNAPADRGITSLGCGERPDLTPDE